jgi:hypothetical protein
MDVDTKKKKRATIYFQGVQKQPKLTACKVLMLHQCSVLLMALKDTQTCTHYAIKSNKITVITTVTERRADVITCK